MSYRLPSSFGNFATSISRISLSDFLSSMGMVVQSLMFVCAWYNSDLVVPHRLSGWITNLFSWMCLLVRGFRFLFPSSTPRPSSSDPVLAAHWPRPPLLIVELQRERKQIRRLKESQNPLPWADRITEFYISLLWHSIITMTINSQFPPKNSQFASVKSTRWNSPLLKPKSCTALVELFCK